MADRPDNTRLYLVLFLLVLLAAASYFFLSSEGVSENVHDAETEVEAMPRSGAAGE